MTQTEINQLMAVVKVNWPGAFKGLTINEKKLAFASWYLALQDIPANIASLAVVKLVATCKYTPTPADIREKVEEIAKEARALSVRERSRVRFEDDEIDARILFAAERIERECSVLRSDKGPSLEKMLSSEEDQPRLLISAP